MNHLTFPYLSGTVKEIDLPLARYLPPVASGMAPARLKQLVKPGEWVLDPFGSTPILPLEAAEAGYKVLVASNNPVLSFILEILASAPSFSSLQAALSELADLRRGADRLETHLQSLYQTECAACGQTIQAQAFLWKRGETQPYARLYHCPQCGDEGERPVTPRDLERLSIPGNPSLHRARAFERVNLGMESVQESIEEALNTYLSRPLYFLNTLINRIEGLPVTNPHRKLLSAMALVICDEANSLWTYPAARQRPRQLAIPPQFRENNLWLALEKSIQNWTFQQRPVALTCWPELPEGGEGGICLYPGRLKALLPLADAVRPAAAIGVFPRPNQAFWTLSAIWSGWLWGKEAVLPLKGSLERQRYDWNWYAVALHSTFSTLRKITPAAIPLIGFMPELAPGFLAAAVVAGSAAGYDLQGLAIREEYEFAQAVWHAGENTSSLKLPLTEICQDAIVRNLSERNEPTSYINLFAGCLETLSTQEALSANLSQLPLESLTHIQPAINQAFTESGFLKRYESASQNLEIGKWWLATPPENILPLADRVEIEVVHYLQKHPGCSLAEVDEAMCSAFPGLLTPPVDLIEACLASYAEVSQAAGSGWHLRPGESAAARKADLLATHRLIERMAVQLGYDCQGEIPLTWKSRTAGDVFQFYPIASSIISRYVLGDEPVSPRQCVLVVPGSRSNLLAYKLKRDPRLAEAVAKGWRFLKFRHLRDLAKRADLSPAMLEEEFSKDPPILESPVQMTMF
jgi:hypothetical protein